MVFFPTSLIFVVAKALQGALRDIREGRYPVAEKGVGFEEYERIVGLKEWADVETRYLRNVTEAAAVPPSA